MRIVPSPSDAEAVATKLSYEFLRNGNYSASSGPVDVPGFVLAIGADDETIEEFRRIPEFVGLAVQSVGFEEGNECPKVHIYLTRASRGSVRFFPLGKAQPTPGMTRLRVLPNRHRSCE